MTDPMAGPKPRTRSQDTVLGSEEGLQTRRFFPFLGCTMALIPPGLGRFYWVLRSLSRLPDLLIPSSLSRSQLGRLPWPLLALWASFRAQLLCVSLIGAPALSSPLAYFSLAGLCRDRARVLFTALSPAPGSWNPVVPSQCLLNK